jgi:hypothetical protein
MTAEGHRTLKRKNVELGHNDDPLRRSAQARWTSSVCPNENGSLDKRLKPNEPVQIAARIRTEADAPSTPLDLENRHDDLPGPGRVGDHSQTAPGFVPAQPSAEPKDNVLKSIQYFKGRDKISVFRDLLLYIPDGLRGVLCNAVDRYLVNRGANVQREELMQSNASLYYALDVQVDKFLSDVWETRHIHATNGKDWYQLSARHDWMWIRAATSTRRKVRTRRYGTSIASQNDDDEVFAYGALGGRLPAKAYFFFKIQVPGSVMTVHEFAFVQTTKAHNSGTTRRGKGRAYDDVDRMPRVARSTMEVVPVGAIDGPAHLVPVDSDESTNNVWIVNTHVDVETWNMVFDREKYN